MQQHQLQVNLVWGSEVDSFVADYNDIDVDNRIIDDDGIWYMAA